MKLLNVGFGNTVAAGRILAVVSADAAPSKRMIQSAKDSGTAIDATAGRRTHAVLVLDTGHVVLSALQPETLSARLTADDGKGEER
jgi:regulator of extracellular matrix RemA (YlzA/DUF370 family)